MPLLQRHSCTIFSRSETDSRRYRRAEQFLDGFGAHHRLETGRAELLVELRNMASSLMTSRSFTGASPGSITT